jgi:excisionase family DNA binding protein
MFEVAPITVALTDTDVDRIAERVAAKILGGAQKPANDTTELLDVKAAAAALKCSVRHLRHLIKMHRIAAVRLTGRGARVRISRREVERFIEESTQGAIRKTRKGSK